MENERKINSGEMPNTDFTYEEFEGLLESFYRSFKPLNESRNVIDKSDFSKAKVILNGFARRHGVRSVEEIDMEPPKTKEDWGQPNELVCFSLLDMCGSFIVDFGICDGSDIDDFLEREKLKVLIEGILVRHEVRDRTETFYHKTLEQILSEEIQPRL